MAFPNSVFKARRSAEWTRDRIDKLARPEIEQLRDNAGRLGESEVVTLCESVLLERPKRKGGRSKKPVTTEGK
ncbi:MAG: hypothetical protein O2979_11805 [Proteobacteria bacterium]|nr:hypothetical protein [Pseudomonadota bacterium]